jgi:hypothetical protein
MSARNLALIPDTAHLGRNSFRRCDFWHVGPTIGTAILDISTCCHTGWACQPNNRYNRIKRRFSRRTRELRRVGRIFGPTGRIRNRALNIARSGRAVGIIDTTRQNRRDFDLSRSAQDTCTVSVGESIQSVAANQYSECSGRRPSRAMPEFDRRHMRNRRRNREESERNNRPSPSNRAARNDWDFARLVPRRGGSAPDPARSAQSALESAALTRR